MIRPYDVFQIGYTGYAADMDPQELRDLLLKRRQIVFYGFESREAAQQFAAIFPKYVKIFQSKVSGWGFADHCRTIKRDPDRGYAEAWICCFEISGVSRTTGEVNETGIKRIDALIRILKQNGWLQS